MLDLIPLPESWLHGLLGQRFAVATIVSATGSVPRPVGTSMLVSGSGAVLGSLSGGCVEGAVVALAEEAMDDGAPRLATFGFSAEDAFAAGLTCGGALEVHVQPVPRAVPATCPGERPGGAVHPLRAALLHLAGRGPGEPVALVRLLDGAGGGAVVLSEPATAGTFPELAALGLHGEAALQVESLVRSGGAGLVRPAGEGNCLPDRLGQSTPPRQPEAGGPMIDAPVILVESRLAPPRMLVFGANDFGAALVPAAKLLGYHVTLVDARPAFARQPRFAAADSVVTDWPHRYLAAEAAAHRLDSRTVVAVLTHDPKFDLPLLEGALALDLAYVGAMGSRRSHLQRVDGLLGAGVRPERIAQLHSPIGLDINAVTPAEVAVSITAELIASRSRSAGCTPLRDASGPIHQTAPPAPTDFINQEIAWT